MEQQSNRSHKQKKQHSAEQVSRRDFLKMGISAMSMLAILEVGGASLLFMQPRQVEGAFGGVVNAGPADSFQRGSVVEFTNGRFFLVRAHDGGFLAVYRRCTHLGCSVNWDVSQGRFFCPCHASSFDIHGDVQNPPAPRALDTFPVTIQEGMVMVNTAQGESRDKYTPEQLTYA